MKIKSNTLKKHEHIYYQILRILAMKNIYMIFNISILYASFKF